MGISGTQVQAMDVHLNMGSATGLVLIWPSRSALCGMNVEHCIAQASTIMGLLRAMLVRRQVVFQLPQVIRHIFFPHPHPHPLQHLRPWAVAPALVVERLRWAGSRFRTTVSPLVQIRARGGRHKFLLVVRMATEKLTTPTPKRLRRLWMTVRRPVLKTRTALPSSGMRVGIPRERGMAGNASTCCSSTVWAAHPPHRAAVAPVITMPHAM